jgi:hypothetical protein
MSDEISIQHAGLITKRHRYEDVAAPPPAA